MTEEGQRVNQYSLKFRTLAAASSWNEQALITVYRQGLDPKLRLHLAAYDDTLGLERFIQLSIRCSNRMQSCSPDFPAAIVTPPYRRPEISSPPEPMQTDSNRLSSAERRRRLMQGLCLYCGASGHMIMACPLRPPRPMVSAIQPSLMKMNPLSTCAQLTASMLQFQYLSSLTPAQRATSLPEASAASSVSRPQQPKQYTKSNP